MCEKIISIFAELFADQILRMQDQDVNKSNVKNDELGKIKGEVFIKKTRQIIFLPFW